MPAVIAEEIGRLAADAVADIATGIAAGSPVADYVYQLPPARWKPLQDGGWDLVGAPDDGATLRDLVEVCLAWGEHILPLPLVPSMFAKRWSPIARDHPGPVTVSVATASGPVAPFGGFPDIRLLSAAGQRGETLIELEAAGDGDEQDFAPSLRLRRVHESTMLAPAARHELAVLWTAEVVGGARSLLADSVAYARTREQFGQPIGRFQAVKHHLANAHIAVELGVTAVCWASQSESAYGPAVRAAFDASQRAMQTALQIHGGMGFTWEMGLHFYLRHLLSLRELVDALVEG